MEGQQITIFYVNWILAQWTCKKIYLKSMLQGFFHGFLPKVERVRREVKLFIYISLTLLGIFHIIQTREASKSSSWLVSELTEWLLDALGALMGKGGCRDMVACR